MSNSQPGGGTASRGCASSIRRSSVEPERGALTTKNGFSPEDMRRFRSAALRKLAHELLVHREAEAGRRRHHKVAVLVERHAALLHRLVLDAQLVVHAGITADDAHHRVEMPGRGVDEVASLRPVD